MDYRPTQYLRWQFVSAEDVHNTGPPLLLCGDAHYKLMQLWDNGHAVEWRAVENKEPSKVMFQVRSVMD